MSASLAEVRVPATTANLGPGFDSFGVALDLHLVARAVSRTDQRLVLTGEGAAELSTDDDNLLWEALTAFCIRHDQPVPDVSVEVDNAIPLARGLGSSSSAIVAGIALARQLVNASVSDVTAVELAAELEGHPDNVAPATIGGFVVCGVDDSGHLVVRTASPSRSLRPVVFVPEEQQLTSEARAVLPTSLSASDAATQAARAGLVTGAVAGLWPPIPTAAGDRLHEPARLEIMGPSGDLIAALRQAGVHAWLSGAGPSVAAVVPGRGADDLDTFTPPGWRRLELGWDRAGAFRPFRHA